MLPDSIVYNPDFQALFEPLRENPKDPAKVNIDYGRANILGDWLEEHQNDAHPQILWFANLIRGDLSVLVKPKPTNPVYQEKTLVQILNACFLKKSEERFLGPFYKLKTPKALQRRILDELSGSEFSFESDVWSSAFKLVQIINMYIRTLRRINQFSGHICTPKSISPKHALLYYSKKFHFHYPEKWTDALRNFSPTWPITTTPLKMQDVCMKLFRRICDETIQRQDWKWLFK